MFLPEAFRLHHRIGLCFLFALELELFVGDGVEIELAVFCGTLHLEFLEEVDDFQLHQHIVLHQHLFAGRKFLKLLNNSHPFHKVDIRTCRDTNVRFLHSIGGIGKDIQGSGKTEVLGIVRCEVHTDTLVVVDHQGILDEIAVEIDGRTTGNRTGKRILQKAYLIFVDVDICEAVLQHCSHNISGIEQVVEPRRALTQDQSLVAFRTFAVDIAAHRLVDRNRQNQLAGFIAHFDMLFQEGKFLELTFFKDLVGHFIESKYQLAVFVDAAIIMLLKILLFLGCNDLSHEFDGWIVLSRILATLNLDHRFLKRNVAQFQFHLNFTRSADLDRLGFIADGGNTQFPRLIRQGKYSIHIGLRTTSLFVNYVDERQLLPGLGIHNDTDDRLSHYR
ncbi:hypothetical protein EVA_20269 [gut metagenome]|uniref:NAD-specific glutamate dehydrogenase n=1 Tax=gut metagenome TaxID=749906 RepID=J9BVQ4_9ZZZZ